MVSRRGGTKSAEIKESFLSLDKKSSGDAKRLPEIIKKDFYRTVSYSRIANCESTCFIVSNATETTINSAGPPIVRV